MCNVNYKYMLGYLNYYVYSVALLFCYNEILHIYGFDYTETLWIWLL